MNKSKNDTNWSPIDWVEICTSLNNEFGTHYKNQRAILRRLYYSGISLSKMAEFIGISVQTLTNKLVREGIHEIKKYGPRQKVGELRKFIRNKPIDFFEEMDPKELEKLFPNHNINHVRKVLIQEGKQWKKKWYWAKYDKDKYYQKWRK